MLEDFGDWMVVKRERKNQRKRPGHSNLGMDKNYWGNNKETSHVGTSYNKFQLLNEVEEDLFTLSRVQENESDMQLRSDNDRMRKEKGKGIVNQSYCQLPKSILKNTINKVSNTSRVQARNNVNLSTRRVANESKKAASEPEHVVVMGSQSVDVEKRWVVNHEQNMELDLLNEHSSLSKENFKDPNCPYPVEPNSQMSQDVDVVEAVHVVARTFLEVFNKEGDKQMKDRVPFPQPEDMES